MRFNCAHCGKARDMCAGHVNRARKAGLRLFCGRRCAGLARRKHKTKAQKIEEKRIYDAAYRKRNLARIRARKAEYFQRTYDPAKAAIERKKRMPRHVEYCRRPEYKAKKRVYDRNRRDSMYGPFAEAARLTIDLNREIKGRMTNHEIRWENKTCNKTQFRDRDTQGPRRDDSRPRQRSRAHQESVG